MWDRRVNKDRILAVLVVLSVPSMRWNRPAVLAQSMLLLSVSAVTNAMSPNCCLDATCIASTNGLCCLSQCIIMPMHLDDVLHESMTLLALYNLSCISFFFFLVSDGLTAGLKWEKDNCFALLNYPLCISQSLLSVALPGCWLGVKLLEVLGWINFISPGWYSLHCHCRFCFCFYSVLSPVKNG